MVGVGVGTAVIGGMVGAVGVGVGSVVIGGVVGAVGVGGGSAVWGGVGGGCAGSALVHPTTAAISKTVSIATFAVTSP